MNILARFLLAVSAVTALPVADIHENPHALAGLTKYLPAVGLLLGGMLAAMAIGLKFLMVSNLVLGVLLTLAWLALTGGMHIDGLMDAADGIFSHRSPERMLEIMRDSRVGNFGVLTGIAVLLIKIAGLAGMRWSFLAATLLLLPVWARWCEAFAIAFFPYARAEGMGKIWHDTARFPGDLFIGMIVPALTTVGCGMVFGWANVALLSMFAVLSGLAAAFYIGKIVNGHTGDTYGAVVEIAEAGAFLLAMLVHPMWRNLS